jgi:hypothetical protein
MTLAQVVVARLSRREPRRVSSYLGGPDDDLIGQILGHDDPFEWIRPFRATVFILPVMPWYVQPRAFTE